MSDVAVVILAAGMSTRLGRPKQTLPLAGQPLASHVARKVRASQADRCIAVIGSAGQETQDILDDIVDEVVTNPAFATGQGSSISTGIRYLDATSDLLGTCHAAIFVLADQPGIETHAIDAVIAAWREGGSIIMAQYDDRAGHPVLFDRRYWSELAELHGDHGGRDIIARHNEAVAYVRVHTTAPMDVDTEADWRRVQEMWPEQKG